MCTVLMDFIKTLVKGNLNIARLKSGSRVALIRLAGRNDITRSSLVIMSLYLALHISRDIHYSSLMKKLKNKNSFYVSNKELDN